MSYLLDTCVVSELASKRPDPAVVRWIEGVDPERVYLSVITIGEVRKGIEKVRDPGRKETLATWLRDELLVRFRDRLAPLGVEVLLEWGGLAGRLESLGKPMPAMDSLLAATALHHGFVFVTRNESDFRNSGVMLLNPWKDNPQT